MLILLKVVVLSLKLLTLILNIQVSQNITFHTTPLHVYHATINEVARFESGDADARITIRDNTSDANIVTNAGALHYKR